jgi:2-C-methyl-D-erythritol 4-phosphate cytidylyltransferase
VFVSAIIPAAGKGQRFGSQLNKQFVELKGRPLLYYTLRQFELSTAIDEIILVVPEAWLPEIPPVFVEQYQFSKIKKIVSGGKERFESVANGLQQIDSRADMVVVHDGVRPFISTQLIAESVDACAIYRAVALAVPVKDTIKVVEQGVVQKTLDRSVLWAVQTPQVFQANLLREAYAQLPGLSQSVTDDAMLVEALGHPVRIIAGDYRNIKITSPDDLHLAEFFISQKII